MNSKLVFTALLFLVLSSSLAAQNYAGRTGHLNVKSTNRIMDIEADNYQVQSKINMQSGDISFTGLTKSFEMKSGALDRAFNSKRVNINGYPKFNFEGAIVNPENINLNQSGRYKIRVKGELTVGDLKRITSANGYVTVNDNGTIRAESSFVMKIEEFNVERINDMMKKRIPSGLGINFNSLGISRDILIDLKVNYRKRG